MSARSRLDGCAKLARDLAALGWTHFSKGEGNDAELLALARMLWMNDVHDAAALGALSGLKAWSDAQGIPPRAMRFLQHVIEQSKATPTSAQQPASLFGKRGAVASEMQQGRTESLHRVPPRIKLGAEGPRKTMADFNLPGPAVA